jgi:hypothetical protein
MADWSKQDDELMRRAWTMADPGRAADAEWSQVYATMRVAAAMNRVANAVNAMEDGGSLDAITRKLEKIADVANVLRDMS